MEAHIAICITTRNRYEVFKNSLYYHGKYRPDGSMLFVVDDASNKPVRIGGNFYRFDENVGIAKAKNKCLELAYNAGAEHIFLFDSDCYPISQGWEKDYINSGDNHLMYQFKLPGKPQSDMRELERDDKLISYSHTRGAMIYVTKKVLETVGGFDEEYGTFFEHPDYTNRIHNAGMTKYRAADVIGSDKLFYCLDQDGAVESSISDEVKKANWRKNYLLYCKNKKSKEFKEYRNV